MQRETRHANTLITYLENSSSTGQIACRHVIGAVAPMIRREALPIQELVTVQGLIVIPKLQGRAGSDCGHGQIKINDALTGDL